MPASSHIHVRQMEIGDFDFVRDLAAKQPNFTVPLPYVLWLLLRIKDAVCLVAEYSGEGPLGYLLAVPIEAPKRALHVWQFAVSDRGGRLSAATELLRAFDQVLRRQRVQMVAFSSAAGSSQFRAVRRAIWNIWAAKPVLVDLVPRSISRTQTEYRFEIDS